MKNILIIAFIQISIVCNAQLSDSFSDGDFNNNPPWSGSVSNFIINSSLQLQLSATGAGSSYLFTPLPLTDLANIQWEIYIRQNFSPSGNNYGRIYLASDQSNLLQPLNGYYIQLGEPGSNDAVELFRSFQSLSASICKGTPGMIAGSFAIRIKVTRDEDGLWSLFVDYTGGSAFVFEGSGIDTVYNSSAFTGVACVYTAANATRFFVDDFYAGPPPGDNAPPTLQNLVVDASNELTLVFSEALDSIKAVSPGNYDVNNGIGNPTIAKIDSTFTKVMLRFPNDFVNGKLNSLSIVGIRDASQNEIIPVSHDFRFFIPVEAIQGDVVINELFPDPSPVIGLPSSEFVELFNTSDHAFDLGGWTISDPTTEVTLPSVFLLPGEFLIITGTASIDDYSEFGNVVGLPGIPSLNNSADRIHLRSLESRVIDSVGYQLSWYHDAIKSQGGYTLEKLDPGLNSNVSDNWSASEDSTGGTPGRQNSVFGRNPDSVSPMLLSLNVINDKELVVTFNEAVQSSSTASLSNFYKDDFENPEQVVLSSDKMQINLTFPNPFVNGVQDTLTILSAVDLAGNMTGTIRIPFRYFISGEIFPGAILFTEIMADPSPVVQLPEAEYIELVNASNEPLNIDGWLLSDATSVTKLPSTIILPGELLILTSTTNKPKFSSYGKVCGVAGFPSLNNTGELLSLKTPDSLLIDSVHYHLQWYQDDDKADGGWSLERLHYEFSSSEPLNWRASMDSTGGTPGKVNSLFGASIDTSAPAILSAEVVSSNEIQLTFSEAIDTLIATSIFHYLIGNNIRPSTVNAQNASVLTISFDSQFQNGVDEELLITGIADLAGNTADTLRIPFRYFVSGPIYPGVIVINEIMSDPVPVVQLPEAEYIELFNVANYPIDIEGWKISDATSVAVIPRCIILPGQYLILSSINSSADFKDYGGEVGVPGFPSLNNAGEPLAIRTNDGQLIDSVNYNVVYHDDKVKADGGWSLERLSYEMSGTDSANWRSSKSIFGGTPGRINSVFGENPDKNPPIVMVFEVVGPQELKIDFSEAVDPESAMSSGNFILSDGDYTISLALSEDGRTVQLTTNKDFANGVLYTLVISAVLDLSGNEMVLVEKEFRYFIRVAANSKDVIMTEIMADPSPVVQLPDAEYVEIHNHATHPFDLAGWILTDGSQNAALPSYVLFENEYLVLTSASNISKFSGVTHVLGIPGFPSLSNTGESLVLKNDAGTTIDSVNFSSTWYKGIEKADGGWSLELIDPNNPCGEGDNWAASENESGGTPGKENSVLSSKPDLTGPELLTVYAFTDSVLLTFSEKLDKSIAISSFVILPDASVRQAMFTDRSLRNIVLLLDVPLQTRTEYHLTVADVYDCNRNAIQEGVDVAFSLTEPADSLDVIMNEVLFNPRPGGTDFIELYNQSPKYIDLADLSLANFENNEVVNIRKISDSHNVMLPGSYRVVTSNAMLVANNYPNSAVGNFIESIIPSMPDDAGTIAIVNARNKIIDFLSYSDDFHNPLVKDAEGVSIERIAFPAATNDPDNWRSASGDVGYATPGFVNSNSRPEGAVTDDAIEITPEIVDIKASDNYATINYHFDQSGFVADVRVFDLEGRLVKSVVSQEMLGFEGFFRWDVDRDDGARAGAGYYMVWFQVFNAEGYVRTFRKRVVVHS